MLPVIRKPNNDLLSSFFNDSFMDAFDNFFNSGWKQDKDGNKVFEIEVPGFNQDNLNVEMSNGLLTVQGETDTRKIYKRYTIGNVEDVKAHIQDGILSLTLIEPKEEIVRVEVTG